MESKPEIESAKPETGEPASNVTEKVPETAAAKSAESEEPYDPGESIDTTVLAGIVKPTDKKPEAKQPTKPIEAPKVIAPEPRVDVKSKRFDRSRKKNEKNYELFLKSLQNMSLQDQTECLVKKTNDMMEEIRTLASSSKLYKSKSTILEKEKEMLQSEQNKNLIARTRLENICRELQRQNKQIKEETAAKIREEEEKRKEVTTKFQTTLNDVSKMMEQNSNENIKLRDDNIQISDRFKKLCEEFKAREEDVQRISKQLSLEKKLSEASFARCQLELEAERCEKEVWLKEKEELLKKLHDTTKDKLLLEINCKNMEEHLTKYSDKYQKFETTITKSNEIFESYKVELASMSNQVAKLETDCLVWKDRWVQTSQSVNRLIAVNQNLEHDLKISDKKLEQLAGLCRFLQTERTRYLKQLKDNNITPEPATTEIVPEKIEDPTNDQTTKLLATITQPVKRSSEATSSPKSHHPLTAKERELQSLRDEIVKLQSEINKAVEKEVEEKLKSKQAEADNLLKGKRRAKGKKGKKNGKMNEEKPKEEKGAKEEKSNKPTEEKAAKEKSNKAVEEKGTKEAKSKGGNKVVTEEKSSEVAAEEKKEEKGAEEKSQEDTTKETPSEVVTEEKEEKAVEVVEEEPKVTVTQEKSNEGVEEKKPTEEQSKEVVAEKPSEEKEEEAVAKNSVEEKPKEVVAEKPSEDKPKEVMVEEKPTEKAIEEKTNEVVIEKASEEKSVEAEEKPKVVTPVKSSKVEKNSNKVVPEEKSDKVVTEVKSAKVASNISKKSLVVEKSEQVTPAVPTEIDVKKESQVTQNTNSAKKEAGSKPEQAKKEKKPVEKKKDKSKANNTSVPAEVKTNGDNGKPSVKVEPGKAKEKPTSDKDKTATAVKPVDPKSTGNSPDCAQNGAVDIKNSGTPEKVTQS